MSQAVATYAYGAGADRLMSVGGGVTTYYAWTGGQIIAEYEASGTNALAWKISYVYMGGKLLATDQAEGIRYHHPDQLGTRLVTDAADGAVISEQLTMPFGTQLPYGSTLGGDNSWQHPGRSNLSKKKFTSYDRSEATGLDYAVNRFYSAQQGRFTQVDPIGMSAASLGNPQTLNLYAYCGNDPINNVDPDGLFWGGIWKALKAIGKAIASFFSAKIGGYSGPGFRTPPTFPGSTPSTISVSSGGNVDFKTPPLVNNFQQASGWTRNSQNVLIGPDGAPHTIYDSVTIRGVRDRALELMWEMNRRRRGMIGLIRIIGFGGPQIGLAVGSGGGSLALNSVAGAGYILYDLQHGDDADIGGAVLTTADDCNTCALKAHKKLGGGGQFYSLQGFEVYRDRNGQVKFGPGPLVDTSSGIYGGGAFENHTIYIKDGKVYDTMGGAWGMPYREWAAKFGVGKEGGMRNMIHRIPISKVKVGRPGR